MPGHILISRIPKPIETASTHMTAAIHFTGLGNDLAHSVLESSTLSTVLYMAFWSP